MNTDLPIITVTLNPAIDQTLTIPGFAAGRVNRVADSHSYPGGKGVNVAVMLADLGAATIVTGFLGRDNAQPFQMLFAQKRIDDQFVRLPGSTRTGLKISDETSGQTTDINFPGLRLPPTAADELKMRLAALVQPGQWVVLAGSVPPGAGPTIYADLCAVVHTAGGRVALDTSGEPLKATLDSRPDLVKPNAAELAELVGHDLPTATDVVAAARVSFIARGIGLAVVSMGGDGAVFVTADTAIRTTPPAVTVKSTVGAGDAMVAGLVFALSRGQSLEAAARLSTALGTYAVTRFGNGLGEVGGHEQYIEQVSVERT